MVHRRIVGRPPARQRRRCPFLIRTLALQALPPYSPGRGQGSIGGRIRSVQGIHQLQPPRCEVGRVAASQAGNLPLAPGYRRPRHPFRAGSRAPATDLPRPGRTRHGNESHDGDHRGAAGVDVSHRAVFAGSGGIALGQRRSSFLQAHAWRRAGARDHPRRRTVLGRPGDGMLSRSAPFSRRPGRSGVGRARGADGGRLAPGWGRQEVCRLETGRGPHRYPAR